MNEKEKNILQIEENFKDIIENDLIKENDNKERVKIVIKDIYYPGEAIWTDKINGKKISEKVFIVEFEEVQEMQGQEKKQDTKTFRRYYLGEKCVAADIGDGRPYYKSIEQDKINAINKLLDKVDYKILEENSLNNLKQKELQEILSEYLGVKVSKEDIEKTLQKINSDELEQIKKDKKGRKQESNLTEKQVERLEKINGIQKINLNRLVDGKQTLGKRLHLEEYEQIYIIHSENAKDISSGNSKNSINNTAYSLVGMKKDGTAKILNDEFEMDKSVGNSSSEMQTKIHANGEASRDNKSISSYTRKGAKDNVGLNIENNQGYIDVYFTAGKTREENENVSIQIETSQTQRVHIETREVFNKNKGERQIDNVQDEIQEHTDKGCTPKGIDINGNEDSSHVHLTEEEVDRYAKEIFEYGDISELFTLDEVKEKLERELNEKHDDFSLEELIEKIKHEMDLDAQNLTRKK